MIVNENGHRHSNKSDWEILQNQPYDYKRHGLLKHLMSHRITESTNPILQMVLEYVERSMTFLMSYIDMLKNFKNYNWKNR